MAPTTSLRTRSTSGFIEVDEDNDHQPEHEKEALDEVANVMDTLNEVLSVTAMHLKVLTSARNFDRAPSRPRSVLKRKFDRAPTRPSSTDSTKTSKNYSPIRPNKTPEQHQHDMQTRKDQSNWAACGQQGHWHNDDACP